MDSIIKRLMENHRIDEMSTVGRFTVKKGNKPKSEEYKVFTTSDSGRPQAHVHIKSTNGTISSCVKLDKPEYFLHDTARDKLSRDQIHSLIDFFRSSSKQRVFTVGNTEYRLKTYWDYTIATWDEENPDQFIQIGIDSEGYIISPEMPNYEELN